MLVERDHELEILGRLAAAGEWSGRKCVAVVRGPVGSGKTALLHKLAESLDDTTLLLFATGSRSEHDLAFGVVDQLFRHPDLPPVARELLNVLMWAEAPSDASLDWPQLRAIHELCTTLIGIAESRPVVLVIDDVHLADAASQHALHFIERRLGSFGIALIIAELADPYQVPSDFRAEITRRRETVQLNLSPLSEGGVASLLQTTVRPVRWSTTALHAATGGSPMLVSALLTDVDARATAPTAPCNATSPRASPSGADDVVEGGPEFSRSVLACLSRLGQQALSVAQSVAVFGLSQGRARVADVPALIGKHTDLDTGHVRHVLVRMEEAGLLLDNDFRHPAAREATLRTIPHAEMVHRCLRAASVLLSGGATHAAVASVLQTLHRVDEDWAVTALREAPPRTRVPDASTWHCAGWSSASGPSPMRRSRHS